MISGRRAWLALLVIASNADAQPAPDAGAPPAAPVEPTAEQAAPPVEPQPPPPQPVPPPPQPVPPPPQPVAPPPVAVPPRRDPYGGSLVDRPLQLTPGATELEVSYEFNTRVEEMVDMMGNVTHERTGFADDYTLDLRVSHAFGPYELGVGLDKNAFRFTLDYDTHAIPVALAIAGYFEWYTNGNYFHTQRVGASHKIVLIPSRLAVAGGVALRFSEFRLLDEAMQPLKGGVVGIIGGGSATAQLVGPFATRAGAWLSGPLWHSGGNVRPIALELDFFVLLGLRKWDFYVGGALFDITRSYPRTYLTAGFEKRWGL